MRTVEDFEEIRRAYFVEKQSIRAIHKMLGYDRETIRKAIVNAAPMPYTLAKPRDAPVIGPYKQRITELLKESKKQKRKQRYTCAGYLAHPSEFLGNGDAKSLKIGYPAGQS